MKILFSFLLIFLIFVQSAYAISDPVSVPNNKIGIHILIPEELEKASELINSSSGDWGYVTIPIQAGDKDLIKWQNFMDEAKKLHIIPILRLATEGDYFLTTTWRKPKEEDILDFSNFLSSLNWPIKNKYIIIFNEVNRADEWNGEANPIEYAQLLEYSTDVFKEKDENFFIITAGMDNAASTGKGTYLQYDFYSLMNQSISGIFEKVDGFSSHSYPNPAFSQPPSIITNRSVGSFLFEIEAIDALTTKKLPIFITETGWDRELFSDEQIGEFFVEAFDNAWNDSRIVAITPFLLKAGTGPFEKFSMLNTDGSNNSIYNSIFNYEKTKGSPELDSENKAEEKKVEILPIKNFSKITDKESNENIKYFVKWLLFPL